MNTIEGLATCRQPRTLLDLTGWREQEVHHSMQEYPSNWAAGAGPTASHVQRREQRAAASTQLPPHLESLRPEAECRHAGLTAAGMRCSLSLKPSF